jgi:hypothetical protein
VPGIMIVHVCLRMRHTSQSKEIGPLTISPAGLEVASVAVVRQRPLRLLCSSGCSSAEPDSGLSHMLTIMSNGSSYMITCDALHGPIASVTGSCSRARMYLPVVKPVIVSGLVMFVRSVVPLQVFTPFGEIW